MHRGLAGAVAGLPEVADATTVLDIATGTGLMLRAIEERHPGRCLVGVDFSPGMLGVARRGLPGATFALADAGRVPVPDDAVDLVTCVTALHLLEHPAAAFAEWARVLRAGGLAVTATFAPVAGQSDGPGAGGFVRRHEHFRTPELVAAALAPHGFRLVRHERWTCDDDRLLVCVLAAGSGAAEVRARREPR
ncbi:methyltransferase domain-containing protein [Nocardioides antri]|uniref:Methyltransferase domain-containing protein n=2 Tax=Nocardioides antri TaxID=2607659 RepID=A0A5B1M6A8_9ACTN|nr:methyltransferase domain-containing protein [Nocardioides antri]